jgi:hypothetical protein
MDNLLDITRTLEFEEYGSITFLSCELVEQDIILKLNVYTGNDENPSEIWYIDCYDVYAHKIVLGYDNDINYTNDHVLLWKYNKQQASISFYGEAKDPVQVVGALFEAHFALLGNEIAFQEYFNTNPISLIAGRFGLLAEGPYLVIQAYSDVFNKFAIDNHVNVHNHLTQINKTNLYALIWKGSYVIASQFKAYKL